MRGSTRRWPAILLVSVLATALSACNGSTGTSGAAAAPNFVPPVPQVQIGPDLSDNGAMAPDALSPVDISPGEIIGADNMWKPNDGDLKTGGQNGATVGKLKCNKTEFISDYHVHIYLGIVYKGKQIAVPDAIGLFKPGPEQNGYISSVATGGCFYYIHTHDASGMIHIEDPASLPPSATPYNMSAFLNLWGVKMTATSFGHFKGKVHVFIGNVSSLGQTTVNHYTKLANATQLGNTAIKSHEVFWVEIGKPFYGPTKLPSVTFYTEY